MKIISVNSLGSAEWDYVTLSFVRHVIIEKVGHFYEGTGMYFNQNKFQSTLYYFEKQIIEELKKQATKLEANAIIGFSISYDYIDHDNIIVSGSGTAIHIYYENK